MYASIKPPKSHDDMQTALENYYPAVVCRRAIEKYGDKTRDVAELFGIITSNLQVRSPIRAFAKSLVDGGVPLSSIYRYRSCFRAGCMDKYIDPMLGVVS